MVVDCKQGVVVKILEEPLLIALVKLVIKVKVADEDVVLVIEFVTDE